MKVAIVGGTGFLGRHLASELVESEHDVVLISRGTNPGTEELRDHPKVTIVEASIRETPKLVGVFRDCQAVYNCAGLNREQGPQTFDSIHIIGTRSILSAMRQANLDRLIHVSFLRARSFLDSPYHHTKWQGEEMVRDSHTKYTIFKPGVLYGEGDGFLSNLRYGLSNLPFVALFRNPQPIAPVHVKDFSRILVSSLDSEESHEKTYPVVGPQEYTLEEIVDLVAEGLEIRPNKLKLPIILHRLAAIAMEHVMKQPLLTTAQLVMLTESLVEPSPPFDELPSDWQARISLKSYLDPKL